MHLQLVVLIVACVPCFGFPWPWDPIVSTEYGSVRGTVSDGVHRFYGIPFAAPPTGELRLKLPTAPAPWSGVREAQSVGPMCPQFRMVGSLLLGNEDCLYLNVFAPAGANASSGLPVMFWIFGGGFTIGDSEEFGWYDGTALAKKRNVVIVSANYRVGPFGFTAHPALQAENSQHTTGNYGVQDQRFALQWARRNVAAFGGDPARITIFGESAGAMSVCWHLVNPLSRGLFASAIIESGTCDSPQFFQALPMAVRFTDDYFDYLGCDSRRLSGAQLLRCIRALPVSKMAESFVEMLNPNWPPSDGGDGSGGVLKWFESLLLPKPVANAILPALSPIMPWGPVIDGTDTGTPALPLDLLQSGKFARVPVIMGSNQDEGTVFVPMILVLDKGSSFPLNTASLRTALDHLLGPQVTPEAIRQYPESSFRSVDAQAAAMVRDYMFTCSTRRALRAITAHGVPAFMYRFSYPLWWLESRLLGLGNYHTSELDFVWDNAWPPLLHAFLGKDAAMADAFGTYWNNLVVSGSPNAPDGGRWPSWPAYNRSGDANLVLTMPPRVNTGLARRVCDFWDAARPNVTAHVRGWRPAWRHQRQQSEKQ